jgi:uncharacterized membrane protein
MAQTWMFLFIRNDNLSVREHHLYFYEIINAQPIQPAQKAKASKKHYRRTARMGSSAWIQTKSRNRTVWAKKKTHVGT